MNYQLIITLGPASDQPRIWQELIEAGTTAFRLNTSHLTLDGLRAWLDRLAPYLGDLPLVLDLQGSKWRLGEFAVCDLAVGQRVELVLAQASERAGVLPVPHADFFKAALFSSSELVLNDARLRLEIESVGGESILARVMQGGRIMEKKGITYTASDFRVETFSLKDQTIIKETRQFPNVRFAVSYVRDAAEMQNYRKRLGADAYLIAKLERGPALAQTGLIAQAANELWLCRGDLGAELGIGAMAAAVFGFSGGVRQLPVPVMMAGQVLEYMSGQPVPTRSEVCYLYDTLRAGYQGVVLSDETAIGRHPVEACRAAAMFRE